MSIELEISGLNRNSKITTIANLKPIYCKINNTIDEVTEKIVESKHRRIPIISRNRHFEGLLTITDILDAYLRKQNFKEKVESIMVRDVIFCNDTDTIGTVLQKFRFSRRGGFPILDNSKNLVGMVSEKDIVKYFSEIKLNVKAKDIMTKKPFCISQNFSIFDCLKTMVNVRFRRLPVVENGRLIGIVTSFDLLHFIKQHDYNYDALDETLDLVVRKDVYTASPDTDISNIVKIMKDKGVGGILIVSNKFKLEGIITERDILNEIV